MPPQMMDPGPDLVNPRHRRIWYRMRSAESVAIAGIAYGVLSIAGLVLLAEFPNLALSDQQIENWFDETDHRAGLLLGLNSVAMSAIAFLWFMAVIRRRLGDSEDQFFASVFFGSGIAHIGVSLVGAAVIASPAVTMTLLEAGSVSKDSASLAAGIGGALILVVAPRLQAVFIFTTSTVIMRSKILPQWLARVGYLTGLLLLIVPLATRPIGLAFPLWVTLVSVVLLVHRGKTVDVDVSQAEPGPNSKGD